MKMLKSERESRVAHNSVILYLRLLFTMIVSLYVSRVVLQVLGVDDFGIFNVVAGFIGMFAILSDSLAQSISRFMNVAIGKKDEVLQKKVFSTSIYVHVFIVILLFIVLQIAGDWFINHKINVPAERNEILGIVFQMALVIFLLNIFRTTFIALIIVHENAKAYAGFQIGESLLKLIAAVSLSYFAGIDYLVLYVSFLLAISLLMSVSTALFCFKNFKECSFSCHYDSSLLTDMMGFSGWTLVGRGTLIFSGYGLNTLLNIFFGVAVNAARGIATQVDGATRQFVYNVTMAVNPQIMKAYAAKDYGYMNMLVCKGAKYTLFVMILYMVPLVCETSTVLRLWLGIVPDYAVVFVRLTFLEALFYVLAITLGTVIQASGEIRGYQLLSGICFTLSLPICWLLFKKGTPPIFAYIVASGINLLIVAFALFYANKVAGVSIAYYLREVLVKGGSILVLSFVLPVIIANHCVPSYFRFILVFLCSILFSVLLMYFLGMNMSERRMVRNVVLTSLKRFCFHG